jgi:putative ABC transport system permease protein
MPNRALAERGRAREAPMSGPWARLRAGWVALAGTGAAASVAFGLLVFAAMLASLAIPRESVGLRDGALQRSVATVPAADQTVTAAAVMVNTLTDEPLQVPASDMAAADATLRSRLIAAGVPVAGSPGVPATGGASAWSSLTTGFVQVSGAAQPKGDGPPQFELSYRTGLAGYSHVVAGRLPGGSGSGTGQVAVTTTVAARFGLRVGSKLSAGSVALVVSGIIQPVDPAASFWSGLPGAVTPSPVPGSSQSPSYWTGALFVGTGALTSIETSLDPIMNAVWWYPAALGVLTAGQAGALETGLSSVVSSGITVNLPGLGNPVAATITTPIPGALSPFIAQENAVDPVLELLYVSLAVLGAVVVLLGARLVAQRRAAELTLIRARGASLYQLSWLVLRPGLVIAAVAGAAGAALAVALTPGDGEAIAWWLAGLTTAVTLIGPVLISVVPRRLAAPAGGRPVRRSGRGRASRRIVLEVVLIAASVGGLVALRNQGLTSAGASLYPSAAPVLVAIPVAVVVLRCYPPLVRELARLAGRSRGVVAFVGLARATRTPAGAVLPSFALVLVLAMVAFPDMIAASVTGAQVAASWQQVGADAVIQVPSGQVISPAAQRQIASVPGVAATATAVVEDGEVSGGSEVPVVFTDPASYAAVTGQAPGARFPLAALSGSGQSGSGQGASGQGASGQSGSGQGGGSQAVPALATPAATQVLGTGLASLTVGASGSGATGTSTVTIRLVGRIGGVPGVSGNSAVLVPLSALGASPPGPSLELVDGSGLDTAQLSAVVGRTVPGATLTLRATALDALTSAPVPQAAQTALTLGIGAAAGFGVLILLLSLLLTAGTREMTLARMATMGLRRWQAQLLLVAETLPPVVAAAVGGIACAWLLAPLVGPSLNLTGLTGTGSSVGVSPAVLPLVIAASGLVLAALLILAAQAVITYHRGSARALRIAD